MIFSGEAPRPDADLRGVRLIAFQRTDEMSRLRALLARARLVRDGFRRTLYDRVFLPGRCALGAALPRGAPLLTNLAPSMRLANEVSGLRVRDLPRARGSDHPRAVRSKRAGAAR